VTVTSTSLTSTSYSGLAGLYYEFNIPMGMYNLLQTVIGTTQNDPNTPQVSQNRAPREWFSQPRPGSDGTTEVIQVNFKLPSTITQLSFQVLRVPCVISAWYQDRNNNWIQMTDDYLSPISLNMTYSAVVSWYTYSSVIYPVVAKAVQFRIVRVYNAQVGNNPYVVGLKETLLRRTIYDASDTVQAIETSQDVLGNTIETYIKNWNPNNVLSDDAGVFWKSFPCPDPNGVVALYLDLRGDDGGPSLVDTVYIDPVYAGPSLNLYYSNDPAQSTLVVNPTLLPPDTEVNVNWVQGTGLADVMGEDPSQMLFPIAFGPLISTPVWIGIEWTPNFNAGSPPADNCLLWTTTPPEGYTGYYPIVYYDVGAGYITCEITNGTTSHSYHAALSPAIVANVPVQIVVGWNYNPSVVYLSVTTQGTTVLGTSTTEDSALPTQISLDGEAGYDNFNGLLTATVIKQEPWSVSSPAFQSAASIYTDPNPIAPNTAGQYPSTSLDNAMFAVDWTSQQYPIGGSDESWYASKTWTPIFSNYMCERGNLYLPQKTWLSYLKLEFTNLVAEPYPVYDQGVPVTYDVFPPSVLANSSTTQTGANNSLLTVGADIVTSSAGSINWFNPSTIQQATTSNWGQVQQNIQVVSGPGTLSTTLPNTAQANISNSYRQEASSPWIYNRKMLNPTELAGQTLTTISSSPSTAQGLQSSTDGSTASGVSSSFTPAVQTSSSNVLPVQAQDWWLFPGANLKMPAAVMTALTGTSVVTARGASAATRNRFTTTCVHRYGTNTLIMDAPLAYFAGLNEVSAYVTDYVSGNDPASFDYSVYDPVTFVYSDNVYQETTGPLTTAGTPYQLENPYFLYPLELEPWTTSGTWVWNSQDGPGSENGQGDEPCAQVTANGTHQTAVSEPLSVSPGDQIQFSALASFVNAVSSGTEDGGTPGSDGSGDIDGGDPGSDGDDGDIDGGDPSSDTSDVGEIFISGITYYEGSQVGTVLFEMPTTTATYTVATQTDMLALSGVTSGQSCTITTGQYQGTYTLAETPASTFANWNQTGYGTLINDPNGNIDGYLFIPLTGDYTVPGSGVDHMSIVLNVASSMTAGTVYWQAQDPVPQAGIEATVSFNATTTSTFAAADIEVFDSGLATSDAMWANSDQLDNNVSTLQLAPYVTTYPGVIPSGMWADTFADWADTVTDWGEELGAVAINVDPNIIYQGNRALHFTRVAGYGNAGVFLTQQTNMIPEGLAQLSCTFFKTTVNSNQIILNFRRASDGFLVHSETFTPVVGYWYTYQSNFFELPDVWDQVYTLEFLATGDAADEIYLSNLVTSVAGIRYFFQLGDSETTLFDITPLAYSNGGIATVSTTLPTNEFSITTEIFSPNSWAYGIDVIPRYLK